MRITNNRLDSAWRGIVIAFCFIALFSYRAQGQFSYNLGVGGKIGSPWISGTVKYFWGNESAVEGLLHFGSFGVGLTALYEYHFHLPSVPGLRIYAGGGAHLASNAGYRRYTYGYIYGYGYGYRYIYNPFAAGHYYTPVYAGLDAVVGVEYIFEKIPLSLSFDITPLINFPGEVSVWWNTGFAARYLFK